MGYPRNRSGNTGALTALLFLLLAVLPAVPENLLANPGFEELTADKPARWDQFVQPKPGAVAELSDTAHSGSYAVWLHTPSPYEKEPVNNWSQNIIANFGGARLRVSGFIRVEGAKEAAIWIQFWRKRPWGVMGAESTSTDMPVYGTKDWEEVSMTVDVPEGTDFVTIRCVLLGSGSAWFDDLAVTRVAGGDETAGEEPKQPAAKPSEAPGPAATEELAPPVNGAPAEAPAQAQQDAVLPMVNQLESEVQRLRDANALLTDTLQEIQDVNRQLLQEMLSVQSELRALKAEEQRAQAPRLEPASPRVPPLIPLSEAGKAAAP